MINCLKLEEINNDLSQIKMFRLLEEGDVGWVRQFFNTGNVVKNNYQWE